MGERIPLGALRWVRIPRDRITFRVSAPDGMSWEYQQPSGEQSGSVLDFADYPLDPCPACGAEAYLDLGPYWGVVRYRCGHQPAVDSEEDDDGDDPNQR